MWSYSTSNPQRPQTKKLIQEFHSRPPARCAGWSAFPRSTCLLSQRRDQTAISKMGKNKKKSEGVAYLIHRLVTCLIWQNGWTKWKQGNFPGPINLWSWRHQKTWRGRQRTTTGLTRVLRDHHLWEKPGKQSTRSSRRLLENWKCLWDEVMLGWGEVSQSDSLKASPQ